MNVLLPIMRLRKVTANKLIARSADVLENFYKAICQVVLQQDYDLTNAVLENFCKTYNAKLERTSTDTKQGYLLKIPVYNARSNLQLHANIPRRRRSTFLNNYQVMLYDISDYRFY